MESEPGSSDTSKRIRLRSAALFAGALVLPPLLVVVMGSATGGGYERALESLHSIPVIGAAAGFVHKVVVSIYFPPFLVTGRVNWALGLLGLYLIFAAIYLVRRRWVHAAILLIPPVVCTWIVSALLLQGD